MNLYPATATVRHLLTSRSTAGYGVHSPFVYDFLTTVVRGKTEPHILEEVESLRREMLDSSKTVRVTDLGRGSVVSRGVERKISAIASAASLPRGQAALLARVAHGAIILPDDRSRPDGRKIILELGTSLGISTLALALALPDHEIVTVEGCPSLAAIARENLQRHGAGNVKVVNAEFSAALSQLRQENARVSFAFIDGNHRGNALIQYLCDIEKMGEEMIIVADDIHLSRDMYRAWRSHLTEVKSSAAMETFRFGIIFRLKSITPGSYRIRC
ncbi:MAG: class I SAM-dependent methyltransferase [Bacteroidales bacterium]|jgi:predicted O-methyltransferase YrrM|nr:class I SAM-dependent methyltransferase [Bacteroidales bacterium]